MKILREKEAGINQPSSRKILDKGFFLALLVVLGLGVLSLFTGVYDLKAEGGYEMFMITRVPRTLALMLTGGSMAMCGLVMQILTQNRFVEPTTPRTN